MTDHHIHIGQFSKNNLQYTIKYDNIKYGTNGKEKIHRNDW